MYLRNAEVKAIIKELKDRIGDVLEALDITMEKQPKKKTTGTIVGPWER